MAGVQKSQVFRQEIGCIAVIQNAYFTAEPWKTPPKAGMGRTANACWLQRPRRPWIRIEPIAGTALICDCSVVFKDALKDWICVH